MTVTSNPFLVAERFLHCHANAYANVFNRVMIIDFDITLRLHAKINHSMTCDLVHHMVEKWHTGIKFGIATAVEVYGHFNLGFVGVTFDVCCTVGHGCHNYWLM